MIDLDAYCARIGYDGPREPTLDVLRALQLLHTQTIAFENLDPLLGRPVRLDLSSLQEKLVHGRRGGYCFEQNLLFQAALIGFGFDAVCLGARVYLDRPPEAGVPARTHLLLRVAIDGRNYLADVGFGGQTPTGPVVFTMGEPRETPHEPFRLLPAGDERDLESYVAGNWKLLYRYGLDVPPPIDIEVANHYVATHPASFFRTAIVAARVAPEGRHTLLNDQLKFHRLGGRTETRTLPDAAALLAALDDIFGIDVPDADALAAIFAHDSDVRATARSAEATCSRRLALRPASG